MATNWHDKGLEKEETMSTPAQVAGYEWMAVLTASAQYVDNALDAFLIETAKVIHNIIWLEYYIKNQIAIEQFCQPEGESGMETRRLLGI